MDSLTIRIDTSADWAEIQQGDTVVRRCHADIELIDALVEILRAEGRATVEWTAVSGPRV